MMLSYGQRRIVGVEEERHLAELGGRKGGGTGGGGWLLLDREILICRETPPQRKYKRYCISLLRNYHFPITVKLHF
jgi:hypothetical protein